MATKIELMKIASLAWTKCVETEEDQVVSIKGDQDAILEILNDYAEVMKARGGNEDYTCYVDPASPYYPNAKDDDYVFTARRYAPNTPNFEFDPEAPPRNCIECKEWFNPSWEHDDDIVCDSCVHEKGKTQKYKPKPKKLKSKFRK